MAYRRLDETWVDDSDEKLYRRTGETFTEVSPSVASLPSEVNYSKNSIRENSLNQITYSGTTPIWNTTYDLFGGGALRCNMTSSGTGRYLRIALDDLSDAQITEMLRLSFFYKLVTGGDDAVRLSIWDGTTHTYLTPEYLISASGSITKYDGWCYSISKTSHYLQFTFKDSTAIDFYIAAVSFVPRVLPQGAVISEWQSYTPTFQGMGAVTEIDFRWRRVGSNIEIVGYCKGGTMTSSEAQVSLPPGVITRSTIVAAGLPCGHAFRPNASTTYYYTSVICEPSKTYFGFGAQVSTAGGLDGPLVGTSLFTSDAYLSMQCSIPVEGWTSSINLVTEAQEFAFNTQTAINTNDTTSFGYGPDGAPILANTAVTYYDVIFKHIFSPGDMPHLELRSKIDGSWVRAETAEVPSLGAAVWRDVAWINNFIYDLGVSCAKVSANKVRVYFMSRPGYGATTPYTWGGNSNALTWAQVVSAADGFDRWRVRKVSNGNMAEAPASGIYESGQNANGYYVKYVDGTMECWGGKAATGLSNGSQVALTFPASFAAGNYKSIIIAPKMCHGAAGGGYTTVVDSSVTSTGFTVGIWAPPSSSYITYRAIGKWNLSRSVAAPGTPTGTNKLFASAKITSNKAPGTASPIPFDVVNEDAYSTITSASGRFTAPWNDVYTISGNITQSSSGNTACIYKNGVFYRYITSYPVPNYHQGFCVSLRLSQGDFIDIRNDGNLTVTSFELEIVN